MAGIFPRFNLKGTRMKLYPFAAIVVLMAATRMHFSGHLPDASLAAFLLAGFFLDSPIAFAALLLEAGLLDYLAISKFGVSDYCISPAYWFLIPAYGVLWQAGRSLAAKGSVARFSIIPLLALSAAFLISNGAFFLFSGRFEIAGIAEYFARVVRYYPPYVLGAYLYLIPAALLFFRARMRHG